MHFKYCTLLVIVVVALHFSLQKVIKFGKRIQVYKGHERYEVGLSINITNYPYQVYCAGSLINPKFILTAARCLWFMTSMEIFVGTKKLHHHDVCAPSAKFKRAIIHEECDYYFLKNDIGLVELRKPLKLSWQIAVVELSTRSDSDRQVGKIAKVTGFARAVEDDNEGNTDVIELVTKLFNHFGESLFTREEKALTQQPGYVERWGKPYGGPLGTPLMLKDTNIQVGVVSFYLHRGVVNVNFSQTLYYTSVGKNLDWIKKNSRLN